jgi:hypothetical protein
MKALDEKIAECTGKELISNVCFIRAINTFIYHGGMVMVLA